MRLFIYANLRLRISHHLLNNSLLLRRSKGALLGSYCIGDNTRLHLNLTRSEGSWLIGIESVLDGNIIDGNLEVINGDLHI